MNEDVTTPQPGFGSISVSRRRALRRLSSAALVAAVLTGARRGMVRAQATPVVGAVEAVARQAIEAVNAGLATGEMSDLDAVFAPDVAGHPPHRSLVTGELFSHDLAGLRAGLADMHQFFPGATITIDDLIASDNTVAARVTFRGSLDAAALGVGEEAGVPLEIGGLLYGRVEDGRIAEFWAYFDPSAYLDLVGLLTATGQATPGAPGGHRDDEATEESAGHGHDETASTSSMEAGAEDVAVTLSEFRIALAPTTLHVDRPYAFVVTNEGTVTHEFVIERPGATHEPLTNGDEMAMVEGIASGETRTLGWTFTEPGSYQLACHEPGHFEAGQVLAIDVAG